MLVLFIICMCGVGDDNKKHNGSYMQHTYIVQFNSNGKGCTMSKKQETSRDTWTKINQNHRPYFLM